MGMEVHFMKSHVWRPLWVVIGLVVIIFVVRWIYVPSDFGTHERGFTYGFYREHSIGDWKKVSVKYQGKDTCARCHKAETKALIGMPHSVIQCENCHGPGAGHPDDPAKLPIDRSRELCMRCHTKLEYPSSARGALRGIDPATHNPGTPCVECHIPHRPTLENLQTPSTAGLHSSDYCQPCHHEQVDTVSGMPHAIIHCESCHGPAGNHPSDPAKLTIDRTRALCVGCHDKRNHNPGIACITCHDPHKSSLQFLHFLPKSDEVSR